MPRLTLALLAALVLTGCATDAVTGRVIEGPAGIAVVVDPTDERLVQPGVPDVVVDARTLTGHVICTATSDGHGAFTLPVPRGQTGQFEISVDDERFPDVHTRIYRPTDGRRLLVIVKARTP